MHAGITRNHVLSIMSALRLFRRNFHFLWFPLSAATPQLSGVQKNSPTRARIVEYHSRLDLLESCGRVRKHFMCLYHKQRARDPCVPAFSNHIASAAFRSVPFNSVPSAFVLQSTLTPQTVSRQCTASMAHSALDDENSIHFNAWHV